VGERGGGLVDLVRGLVGRLAAGLAERAGVAPRRLGPADEPRWTASASRSSGSTSEPMPSSASTSARASRIARPASSSEAIGRPTTTRSMMS
jgi:hypothetical protein